MATKSQNIKRIFGSAKTLNGMVIHYILLCKVTYFLFKNVWSQKSDYPKETWILLSVILLPNL